MIKIFLPLLLALLFNGCISKTDQIKPSEKVFEEEDAYIMFALRAEQLKDYKSASSIFNTLYEKSNKKEYLYQSLQNDLVMSENNKVIKRVDEVTDKSLDDYVLVRFKIVALIEEKKFEEAKFLAVSLVNKSKEVDDFILVSDIYVKQKKYDTAVKYLESAYFNNYDEVILDRISIILYVNLQRKKDAIAQLETYTRMNGCSQIICTRLIGFYSDENNIDGLLSVYLRFYKLEKDSEIAKKIVQIYDYKKEYIKLITFLEETGSDDVTLLRVYVNIGNYKKASTLANKLYKNTGNINYLGQSAIFEYESSENKNDKKMHNSIIKKLTKVLDVERTPLYLNYLGYILIDHSINIKKGMNYVREAIKEEPKSAFYLDSLAWGYYKLGKCNKALEIINKVRKLENGNDAEVLNHLKLINKCIQKSKR